MRAAEFWNADTVREAVGGVWHAKPDHPPALTGGAAIDTRALKPGQIFFAMRGERTDGHRFLAAAHDAGAALAIIDNPDAAGELPQGLAIIRVPDTLAALARLASAYRDALGAVRVIAVTGSNGKTTTVRMIDACLRAHTRGHCSPRSFNNQLGVPLTVLGATPGDRYLLCEVGANDPGEIEPLSKLIRPDIVVVTCVARAHLEGFGSLEGVAAEKTSLAAHLNPGGVVMLGADSPPLTPYRDRFDRVILFGHDTDADLCITEAAHTTEGLAFTLNGRDRFTLPVLGAHNALNATAAVGVARRLGVPDDTIREALAAFTPADMRLALERHGHITIINDAYNANPESMLAGLRTLKAFAPADSRRVAVLGDMLEMGQAGPDAHDEIGRAIAQDHLADLVLAVGPLAAHLASQTEAAGIESIRFASADDPAAIARHIAPGDTVLLKGSRGIALERVLHALRKNHPQPTAQPQTRPQPHAL